MIDWDKLDTNKTYVVLEYGQGIISKLIRNLTKEFCYNMDVPSHVLALVYDKRMSQWLIYESHNVPNQMMCLPAGTRRYYKPQFVYAFPQTVTNGEVYEIKLDVDCLIRNLGRPYGYGDITKLLRACILDNNGEQRDGFGIICSEYLALAYKPIRDFFKLEAYCITPAHWLRYLLDNDIEKVS